MTSKPTIFLFACTAAAMAAVSCGPTVYVTSGATGTTGAGAAGSTSSGPSSGAGAGSSSSASGAPFGPCSAPWSETFTTKGTAAAYQVATIPTGEVFVLGFIQGTVDLGLGPLVSQGPARSFYVAKLDCTGKTLWNKSFGAPSTLDGAAQMAVDASGAVLLTGPVDGPLDLGCGPLAGGGFVAKLDGSGACVWSKAFGQPGEHGDFIAVDASGGVVVSGDLSEPVDFGGGPLAAPGGHGAFVVALDADGGYVWGKALAAEPPVVAREAGGGVLLCGQAHPGLDLGGGPLPAKDTLFFARLDPAGGLVWSSGHDASGARCNALTPDASGGLVAVGTYGLAGLDLGGGPLPPVNSPGYDGGFIAGFGPDGVFRLGLGSGGTGSLTLAGGVRVDAAGDILVAGSFDQPVMFGGEFLTSTNGDQNLFVLKVAPSATVVWSRRFGPPFPGSFTVGGAIALSGSGAPLVAGQFLGPLDFGDGTPHQSGQLAPFVAQLAP